MPAILNVQLALRPYNDSVIATVSFSTQFNATEIFAHTVYKAVVELRSRKDRLTDNDTERILHVDTLTIMASSNPVPAFVQHAFSRTLLDEDDNFRRGQNGELITIAEDIRDDEWVAFVKLSPMIFDTVTAESPVQVNQWQPRSTL